jgi:hypothetical protein
MAESMPLGPLPTGGGNPLGQKIAALLEALPPDKREAIHALAAAEPAERAEFLASCDLATRTTLEAILQYLE